MPALCSRLLCLLVSVSILVSSTLATAEETEKEEERPKLGYWSDGEPRFFLSLRPELGIPYAKPYASAGYGLPNWIWTGFDANAILLTDCFQVYGGVRAATPVLDLAFGVRDTFSFAKPFLEGQEHFTIDELDRAPGPNARYWAWEAEAFATIPLPYAAIIGDFIAVGMLDKPEDKWVYDESYRVIVSDDLFFVVRGAAVARFLHEESLKIGVIVEHLFGTGRQPVTRIGPIGSLLLTDHLEINAVLTVDISGPDDLGIVQGSYGVLGVRYRWASGERHPEPPWGGKIIP